MRTLKLIILSIVVIFFSACSQKITVKALIPAQIGDKDIKNLSIERFKNDDIALSHSINSKMAEVTFEGKSYFNIVNREDTNKILEEQKLQDTGLVNNKGLNEYGLSDISSIISGKVNSKAHTKRSYYEDRTDYNTCVQYKTTKDNKKYCTAYRKYSVSCQKHTYNISANINITRVSNSDIIFSKTFLKETSQKVCVDSSKSLASKQSVYELLAKSIADEFVSYISPSYRYLSLTLIEDEDIDYNDTQEKMLENALKLIELKDIVSANELLKKLVNSTAFQSSTALYDLGVTYEYLGELEKAFEVYQKAKNITMQNDLDENIINAVNRIKRSISDSKLAKQQIDN